MRVSSFSTVRPQMTATRTCEDFYKFLGAKPARLGMVSQLYEQYTASYLTESLKNIYAGEKDKKGRFESINSFMVEWDLNVNFIKRLPILSREGNGAQGSDITFVFPENYYQKNDVMVVEDTRQQVIFLTVPIRRSDANWEIVGKLQDSDYSAVWDEAGDASQTRFLTNYQPELHETGYVKYQSNVEKHRTYIATHRADVSYSAKYRAMEDVFIQIGKGSDLDPVYKMNAAEKDCLDSFMAARAGALLAGKTNVDKDGKPKIYDPETGQPIISGDGLIPQVERFAGKMVFNRLTPRIMNKAIIEMTQKSESAVGNKYVFICNSAMWAEIQSTLMGWLGDMKTDGTFLYSEKAGDYVKVGNTFNTYEFAGNFISFKIDRALDVEYPTRKYGFFLDLTADKTSGTAAVKMFTFKGCEFCHNWLLGVGGKNGVESGAVSSPVAATKLINWGYAGIGVMNPYRSYILMGDK